ncbi:MAG: glycine cleavage system protein GcvH [Saprospiraceae bacterium]|nr:glycine cleavage system protein GcvH [Saprospiraceae bacterium]
MKILEDLKYTKEHEWLRIEGNVATIGITDFAQSELGEIVYVEVDTVGEVIAKDEIFGTIEAVKTTSDLFIPVTGKVIEFNTKISEDGEDQPDLVNADPYGDGWIIKIEIENMDELESLMNAEDYKALIS